MVVVAQPRDRTEALHVEPAVAEDLVGDMSAGRATMFPRAGAARGLLDDSARDRG
jgi:hypothetical protein